LRVLQVVPYFPPAWSYGGPVKISYDIAKNLVRRGHEVTVYTSDVINDRSRREVEIEEMDGIQVHRFRTILKGAGSAMKLFVTPEMIPIVREKIDTFDVIHLHEYRSFQNLVIHHYAKKFGRPYILQAHGSLPRILAKQRLKWIFDAFFGLRLLRDADRVIAISQIEAKQYENIGLPREKIHVIPNGIDLSEYNSLPQRGVFRKKYGIGDNEKIVLYLGRIHRIKGIDLLIEAFANLQKELKNVKLVIVGPDDGYLFDCRKLARRLRIDENVLFITPLYGINKLQAYVDADVYVLPSRYDASPISVLESIACGTPVILSENCCVSEILGNNVGVIVRFSPEELRQALFEVLTKKELLRRFRMNCGPVVKHFGISNAISKLERVYEEVHGGIK